MAAHSDGIDREAFRAALVAQIPRWYSPWGHLAFPSLVGLFAMAICLASLREVRGWQLLTVPLVWVISNAFEWRAHRDILHRRQRFLEVLYDRHTPQHHRIFLTDDMAIRSSREFRLVLIPAYGILGIALLDAPLAIALTFCGQRNIAALFVATSMAYVLSYEWLHLSYHLPPESWIGRRWLVRKLRRHHAIHHAPERMQKWNFNVTIPLWDWLRGTIFPAEQLSPEETLSGAASRGQPPG